MAFTALIIFCHFPMWGSMFFGPRTNAPTEEQYYTSDYTPTEKEAGKDNAAKLFAKESLGERGSKHGSHAALTALDADNKAEVEAALPPKA
jgi:NNP family nitrate/nitrite transporter-like MFS transporter